MTEYIDRAPAQCSAFGGKPYGMVCLPTGRLEAPLPMLLKAIRDAGHLDSWALWEKMRAEGRIEERRTGPEHAVYSIAADEPIAVFLEAVNAERLSW